MFTITDVVLDLAAEKVTFKADGIPYETENDIDSDPYNEIISSILEQWVVGEITIYQAAQLSLSGNLPRYIELGFVVVSS